MSLAPLKYSLAHPKDNLWLFLWGGFVFSLSYPFSRITLKIYIEKKNVYMHKIFCLLNLWLCIGHYCSAAHSRNIKPAFVASWFPSDLTRLKWVNSPYHQSHSSGAWHPCPWHFSNSWSRFSKNGTTVKYIDLVGTMLTCQTASHILPVMEERICQHKYNSPSFS